jgi:hypothetical protein
MSHARAALAGALTMLLGIWVMTNDQSAWETRDVVFAIISLALVILLLVGIDVRRGYINQPLPPDDKEDAP